MSQEENKQANFDDENKMTYNNPQFKAEELHTGQIEIPQEVLQESSQQQQPPAVENSMSYSTKQGNQTIIIDHFFNRRKAILVTLIVLGFILCCATIILNIFISKAFDPYQTPWCLVVIAFVYLVIVSFYLATSSNDRDSVIFFFHLNYFLTFSVCLTFINYWFTYWPLCWWPIGFWSIVFSAHAFWYLLRLPFGPFSTYWFLLHGVVYLVINFLIFYTVVFFSYSATSGLWYFIVWGVWGMLLVLHFLAMNKFFIHKFRKSHVVTYTEESIDSSQQKPQ
jgi:hypothetical protein